MSTSTSGPAAYQSVATGVGFADRSERERLEITGPDRARFLHNLTTNEVKRLAVGEGREAFVTSPQGKTLGFVTLLAGDDRIIVVADSGGLVAVLPHFRKYGLFDEVEIEDVRDRTFEFHLAGPRAESLVLATGATLPDDRARAHLATRMAGCLVRVVRDRPTGRAGLTILGDRADESAVSRALHDLEVVDIDPATFDVLRIEAGTPVFGRDLGPDNLPQELGRDATAISFVKGCYLGQETVARIDALGHVNRQLLGLKLEGATVPPPGAELHADGKAVGAITSAAFSPGWGGPLALAYVKRSHARAGTPVVVRWEGGDQPAVLTDLPMLPPGT